MRVALHCRRLVKGTVLCEHAITLSYRAFFRELKNLGGHRLCPYTGEKYFCSISNSYTEYW